MPSTSLYDPGSDTATMQPTGRLDLLVHHARIVSMDGKQRVFEALGIRHGRVAVLGNDGEVFKLAGPDTRVVDADGMTVLPGLQDSHVHPVSAALSELKGPLPSLQSLDDAFAHIKKKAAATPAGEWIILRYAFPTRLEEARFPTRAELDRAAPDHPVLYHAGPAGMTNTAGLKRSGITRDTPNPKAGAIVKDPKTGEPTGMLRNAYGLLKGLPPESGTDSFEAKRNAVRKLLQLYASQGLTSISDRDASREELEIYLSLHDRKELPVRVNVARSFGSATTPGEVAAAFDALTEPKGRGGPTGTGDPWLRIGPIKLYMDGGMLNGSAYMREPWPAGDTYQIVENDYRGLLYLNPDQLLMILLEAARRGWQATAHTAGEGAMDVLLDAYALLDRQISIKNKRFCITHANFPSQRNLELCRSLGVCADVQPAWLWKDGTTLLKVLGEKRMRWFQPYKSWLKYTTIGGGSDHMIRLDPIEATNPWSPWLGMWTAIARVTERGTVLTAQERLTREEALRLYTANNAYLSHEENEKGTIEIGKHGDVIIIDRDFFGCPLGSIPSTKVVCTIVGGKVIHDSRG